MMWSKAMKSVSLVQILVVSHPFSRFQGIVDLFACFFSTSLLLEVIKEKLSVSDVFKERLSAQWNLTLQIGDWYCTREGE